MYELIYNISEVEKGITYSTKSFITGNFTLGIIMVTGMSLGFMFLLVVIGLPNYLTIALFIGSLVVFIAFIAGDTQYIIDKKGIHRKVNTMLVKLTGLSREDFFAWKEIEWYETGSDLNRSMTEYNYLTIKFKGVGNQWKISDSAGKGDGFRTFANAFIKLAGAYNESEQPISARLSKIDEPRLRRTAIKRKNSFYGTLWSKVLTGILSLFLFCIFAFYAFNPNYLKATHLWRILLILLPGLSYMVYRTFIKKD